MDLWPKIRARLAGQREAHPLPTPHRFPNDWDPESSGSRYAMRPALAVMSRPGHVSRFETDDDIGDGPSVVHDALAAAEVDTTDALGEFAVVDGSYGRGAAGWVPVVEWLSLTVASGATWEAVRFAARRLTQLLKNLRKAQVQVSVSRGTAALLAISYVLAETSEEGVLDVEAVEEPSGWRGQSASELNYTDTEPWLISILNEQRTKRYVVAVASDGEVIDWMALPMSETERFYTPPSET